MPPVIVAADAVIPMLGDRLIRQGGVLLDAETITAVGMAADLQAKFPTAHLERFPGLLLPGLINAHAHLELGYQRRQGSGPVRFTEWVAGLMKNYPPADALESLIAQAVREGVRESLAAGVTCIGGIGKNGSRRVGDRAADGELPRQLQSERDGGE